MVKTQIVPAGQTSSTALSMSVPYFRETSCSGAIPGLTSSRCVQNWIWPKRRWASVKATEWSGIGSSELLPLSAQPTEQTNAPRSVVAQQSPKSSSGDALACPVDRVSRRCTRGSCLSQLKLAQRRGVWAGGPVPRESARKVNEPTHPRARPPSFPCSLDSAPTQCPHVSGCRPCRASALQNLRAPAAARPSCSVPAR